MKSFLFATMMSFAIGCFGGTSDIYRLQMSLKVPRIFDNMASQGYRKYQVQKLTGCLKISYGESGRPVVSITNLVNHTHRIGGKNIVYDTFVDDSIAGTRVNLIGNNRINEFKTPSVVFYIDADPSYNVGEDDEDNSLLGIMAGKGSTEKVCEYRTECKNGCLTKGKVSEYRRISNLSGNFAGTLGCGCRAYGHVSPTRTAGPRGATEEIDDVASAWGTWTAVWKERVVE